MSCGSLINKLHVVKKSKVSVVIDRGGGGLVRFDYRRARLKRFTLKALFFGRILEAIPPILDCASQVQAHVRFKVVNRLKGPIITTRRGKLFFEGLYESELARVQLTVR